MVITYRLRVEPRSEGKVATKLEYLATDAEAFLEAPYILHSLEHLGQHITAVIAEQVESVALEARLSRLSDAERFQMIALLAARDPKANPVVRALATHICKTLTLEERAALEAKYRQE